MGRWRRAATATSLALLAGLGGCARGVEAAPAPSASDPVCAELLLSLPESLGGAERRSTTSQASRAWGDPAIVLRCGVEPLGPTTDPCYSIADPEGEVAVDWVAASEETEGGQRFTTYGRTPAVEVTIPLDYAGDPVLAGLAEAVAPLPQERECL